MIFYHLSRCGTVSGNEFKARQENISQAVVWDSYSGFYIDFPFISNHGFTYLNKIKKTNELPINSTEYYEVRLEYIRRTVSIDLPSRMQSLFACKSIKDMWKFAEVMNLENGIYPVYGVTSSSYMEFDMCLVDPMFQHSMDGRFQAYWNGCTEHPPCTLKEVVMKLPVMNKGLETLFFIFKPSFSFFKWELFQKINTDQRGKHV